MLAEFLGLVLTEMGKEDSAEPEVGWCMYVSMRRFWRKETVYVCLRQMPILMRGSVYDGTCTLRMKEHIETNAKRQANFHSRPGEEFWIGTWSITKVY